MLALVGGLAGVFECQVAVAGEKLDPRQIQRVDAARPIQQRETCLVVSLCDGQMPFQLVNGQLDRFQPAVVFDGDLCNGLGTRLAIGSGDGGTLGGLQGGFRDIQSISLFAQAFLQLENQRQPMRNVSVTKPGYPKKPQALHLFGRIVGRIQIGRFAKCDQLVPQFVSRKDFEQSHAAVRSAATGQRVMLRVARNLNEVSGERQRLTDAANVAQIADQPLIVVCIVVNLIGKNAVAKHVGVVDAGRGFLLPGGIGIALEI